MEETMPEAANGNQSIVDIRSHQVELELKQRENYAAGPATAPVGMELQSSEPDYGVEGSGIRGRWRFLPYGLGFRALQEIWDI